MKQLVFFAITLLCVNAVFGQSPDRETALNSLIKAERDFSRASAEKGTRDAFLAFLADEGVVFNPLPNNGKQVWTPREKAPGVLTWTPVFADVSDAGDLGFTTGPYEFRRTADEKPVGHGYYLSVWRRVADGAWKVLLDIGTRNAAPESVLNLETAQIPAKKNQKIDLQRERAALAAADGKLSLFLSEEKPAGKINDFAGDYLRVHRSDNFPVTDKNAALAALTAYQGKINSQTAAFGIASSGDFAYSYGTYSAKTNGVADDKSAESGSFVRTWRRGSDGKWKITAIVMHAAPPKHPQSKNQ